MSGDANPKDALGAMKPPVGLFPWSAVIYASRVMELGAKKYGAFNWRAKKVNRTVYIDAAIRHLMAARDGENTDPESGQPHEAHALSCMGIILDAMATGNLIDDRPAAGAAAKLIAELTAAKPGGIDVVSDLTVPPGKVILRAPAGKHPDEELQFGCNHNAYVTYSDFNGNRKCGGCGATLKR